MDYRRLIPNMCTSSNLVFGMCSILSTYSGNLVWGSIFILLALVADGLDGRTARFFGVASEMGKEMDSLCDLGSFGIAPAFLAWAFVLHNHGFLGVVVAIFFAICGMWRLARFNVNASVVHGYFMGLAIPAGGNIVAMTTLLFVELGVDPMTFWHRVSHRHGLRRLAHGQPRSLSELQGRWGRAHLPYLEDCRTRPVPRHPLARPRIALSGSRCRSVLDVRGPGHRQFSAGKFCKERLIVFVHTSF